MHYNKLGNTGIDVSVVGLGPEHLVGKPYSVVDEVISAALNNGMNIFDMFMPQMQVRKDIAKAIKGRRKDIILQGHIGSILENNQPARTRDLSVCKQYFEQLYEIFDTDYIDIGMMFFVDNEKDYNEIFESGYYDYVQSLKKEGRIRCIGASSHNPTAAKKLVENDLIEVLMFSINPAYDMLPSNYDIMDVFAEDSFVKTKISGIEPARAELYELCEKKGVGITVMKTLGASRLVTKFTPFSKPLTVGQCIHYALSRPAVSSCLVGCQTEREVIEAASYCNLSDAEKDFSQISELFSESLKGKCMYCNHCLPCPSNIDVAMTTKFLDIAKLDVNNIPSSIKNHYNAMEHKASECIECGRCEKNCPFGVPVIRNMRQASELLE